MFVRIDYLQTILLANYQGLRELSIQKGAEFHPYLKTFSCLIFL